MRNVIIVAVLLAVTLLIYRTTISQACKSISLVKTEKTRNYVENTKQWQFDETPLPRRVRIFGKEVAIVRGQYKRSYLDINSNFFVGVGDLKDIEGQKGQCEPTRADLDSDGCVTVADSKKWCKEVMLRWGL